MKVVLDTNTFVAAGFKPSSASARIFDAVANGALTMVWCEVTRNETEQILKRIRPLADCDLMRLFEAAEKFEVDPEQGRYDYIPDKDDRKFAALADAAGATLISSDKDLLGSRHLGATVVLSPHEFIARHMPLSNPDNHEDDIK